MHKKLSEKFSYIGFTSMEEINKDYCNLICFRTQTLNQNIKNHGWNYIRFLFEKYLY